MKVLHVFHEYPKTYQHYLLKPLERLRRLSNSKVLTFDNASEADYNVISERGLDLLQRVKFKLKLSPYKTSFECIASKFDIVHIHHSHFFPKSIPFLTGRLKQKVIITLRGADTYLKPFVQKRWLDFYNYYGNKIDCFITVSEHQRLFLVSNLNIHRDRISVVPVSMTLEKPTKRTGLAERSELKILSSFRLTWEKNIEGNLRVAKILKERGIKFHYTICGGGRDKSMILYFIKRYGLSKHVSLLGKIEAQDYIKVLAKNHIYLQLSFSEALSASVIEAQGYGLPAIVSDADGIPESIIDGKSGFVIRDYNYLNAANRIMELTSDDGLYNQFSSAALRNVKEKFTIKSEVNHLLSIYKSLMN